ncbi:MULTISPECIES: hypothetical protein [unclassified Caballeronia]|uniref:hypothetical protein n=1 Tax=unclassified Caballeronia TaxID=2646786 RepID=UPI00285EFD59|nr:MULTISPECIES: hypothetical protein [unclassified Caballeronia]MDR5739178.1 hypothetical protein [Caballeronia sp. LZ016]MDR5807666.1 hypothetical protein [Caballeronia sp. LZ019]
MTKPAQLSANQSREAERCTRSAVAERLGPGGTVAVSAAHAPAEQSALAVRYADMCRAIAECHRIDEVKEIRDKVLALEVYSSQAKNTDAERQACEIRLRAERRAGVLLKELAEAEMRASGPGQRAAGPGRGKASSHATLLDMGVTRDQSSKWQKLARIPEEDFEAALRSPEKKPTTAALIREIRDPAASAVARLPDDSLWLWGRLRDFERDEYVSKDPHAVFDAMTDTMQADVRRIAPTAIAFLSAMIEGADDEA